MAEIVVERTIGSAKAAIHKGLAAYNASRLRKRPYKRFAVTLREGSRIVGGVIGQVWITVLYIQLFWIDEAFRGHGHGAALISQIEEQARKFGAVRAYVDTMSFQAPGFYRQCGYEEFGSIGGYPDDVTRHWLTKALAPQDEKQMHS